MQQVRLPEVYLKDLVDDLLQPLLRIERLQLICCNHLLQFGCDISLILLIWASRALLRGCPRIATLLTIGVDPLLTRVTTLLPRVTALLPQAIALLIRVTTLLPRITALLPRAIALLTRVCMLLRRVATWLTWQSCLLAWLPSLLDTRKGRLARRRGRRILLILALLERGCARVRLLPLRSSALSGLLRISTLPETTARLPLLWLLRLLLLKLLQL